MVKTGLRAVICVLYISNISMVYSASCDIREQVISNDGIDNYDQQSINYTYIVCKNVYQNNITRSIYEINRPTRGYGRLTPKYVKYVIFQNSTLTSVTAATFTQFPDTEIIYLNHSHVEYLEVGAFNGLRHLKEIYLEYNNLTYIQKLMFGYLPELLTLDLSNNAIYIIETGAFNRVPKLTKLMLANNLIKEINDTIFYVLPSLEYLDISSNMLQLQNNAFSELLKLSTLLLNNNLIEKLTLGYVNHKFLHTLDLSYNSIREFDGSNLPDMLQTVNISNNNITLISNISSLLHLKELDVSFNNIHTVPSDLIKRMDKLAILQMQKNHLREIPIGFFSGCTSMTKLNLSRNAISLIEYGLFSGLNSLMELDISYNEVDALEADAFYSLPELEHLDISFNKVSFLNLYRLVRHCKNLETINLTGNNFTCSSLSTIIRDAKGHFGRQAIEVLEGDFENVTNIHGIPCRNTNNNNVVYKVMSTLPDNKNSNRLNEVKDFFNLGFKNSTFYHFFNNFISMNQSEIKGGSYSEERISNLTEDALNKLSAIQHVLIILVLLIIIYALFQIVRNLLHCRYPRKTSSNEPDFLL